jgi:hypothetical protein
MGKESRQFPQPPVVAAALRNHLFYCRARADADRRKGEAPLARLLFPLLCSKSYWRQKLTAATPRATSTRSTLTVAS